MRLGFTAIVLASASAWASAADIPANCDERVSHAGQPATCATRSNAVFAPITESDLAVLDGERVPPQHVLGCSDTTDLNRLSLDGLTSEQLTVIGAHAGSDAVLMDATIDGVRHLYAAGKDDAIQWKANPDRVVLTLPGDSSPTVALVDVEQGPTRYCMDSKVFVTHAKSGRSASLQIQSNPGTQEVSAGSTAFLQIRIINNGTVALGPVAVTSTLVGTCARTVSSVGAGFTYTYTCSRPNVTAPFSNTVTATGQHSGGSVSATATSTVTLPGGPNPQPTGSVAYTVCRLPWVQYAKQGELARWQFKLTNNQDSPLSAVSVIETVATQCNRTLAPVAVGQTVVWECSQAIAPGPPIQSFTINTSATQGGVTTPGWTITNLVITDYLHVGGFDGCVANGTSNELCLPESTLRPQMRRSAR